MFAVGVLLFIYQCAEELSQRRGGGRQSLGCADAGMGDLLAAAALQLRGDPDRGQPPSAVGRPAGRAGRRAQPCRCRPGAGSRPRERWAPRRWMPSPTSSSRCRGDSCAPLLLALLCDCHLFVGLVLHRGGWWRVAASGGRHGDPRPGCGPSAALGETRGARDQWLNRIRLRRQAAGRRHRYARQRLVGDDLHRLHRSSLFAYLLFTYYYLAVQPHLPGTFPKAARRLASGAAQHRLSCFCRAWRSAGRSSASSMTTSVA